MGIVMLMAIIGFFIFLFGYTIILISFSKKGKNKAWVDSSISLSILLFIIYKIMGISYLIPITILNTLLAYVYSYLINTLFLENEEEKAYKNSDFKEIKYKLSAFITLVLIISIFCFFSISSLYLSMKP